MLIMIRDKEKSIKTHSDSTEETRSFRKIIIGAMALVAVTLTFAGAICIIFAISDETKVPFFENTIPKIVGYFDGESVSADASDSSEETDTSLYQPSCEPNSNVFTENEIINEETANVPSEGTPEITEVYQDVTTDTDVRVSLKDSHVTDSNGLYEINDEESKIISTGKELPQAQYMLGGKSYTVESHATFYSDNHQKFSLYFADSDISINKQITLRIYGITSSCGSEETKLFETTFDKSTVAQSIENLDISSFDFVKITVISEGCFDFNYKKYAVIGGYFYDSE